MLKPIYPKDNVYPSFTLTNFLLPHQYSAVYAAFFFYLFSENNTIEKIDHLNKICQAKWTLNVGDFVINTETKYRWWREIQLKASIIFFRITTNHRLSYLPEVFKVIHSQKFKSLTHITLQHKFFKLEVFSLNSILIGCLLSYTQ